MSSRFGVCCDQSHQPFAVLTNTFTKSDNNKSDMMRIRPSLLLLASKLPSNAKSFAPAVGGAMMFASRNLSTARAERSIPVTGEDNVKNEEASSKEDAVKEDKRSLSHDRKEHSRQLWNRNRLGFPRSGFLSPWSGFDVFRNDPFFASPFDDDFFHKPMSILKHWDDDPAMVRLRSSPGFEIKEDSETYQIAIDIPEGVQAGDINVGVEQDGSVLHVSGERKAKEENGRGFTETRFDQRFTVGQNIDTDRLAANFHDGVLIIKAPKNLVDDGRRKIPISEQPHDTWSDEEIRTKTFSDEYDESDFAESGKAQNQKLP